ncbi:MAG TPA: sensor histidine kinase [Thermoanaerobaculia bacterium]|nr:sensor histidine kinase [Thermoanaerobaculia bacterium]
MKWMVPTDASAERLVVMSRLALGLLALTVVETVSTPGALGERAFRLIVALYSAWALAAAIASVFSPIRPRWYRVAAHLIDVAAALALLLLIQDTATPFLAFAFFAIVSAGLRFGALVILATAATFITTLLAIGIQTGAFGYTAAYAPRGLFAVAFMIILALTLAHSRARDQKMRLDLDRLAKWPRSSPLEPRELLRDTLANAAAVVSAKEAVLVWEETEEPWLHIASLLPGDFRWHREAPDRFNPLIHPDLKRAAFFSRDFDPANPVLHYRAGEGTSPFRGEEPIHPDFAERLCRGGLISVCMEGEDFQGRLFLAGVANAAPDTLITAQIVGDLAAGRLDHYRSLVRGQEAAVSEERVRLSRDLHDGLLQSLTGVALHLQTAQKMVHNNPAEAARNLEEIQDVIAADQRGLRSFIQQLRPYSSPATATLRLTGRLEDLAKRFQNQFGLKVHMRSDSLAPMISDEMRQEIFSIVNEALANAAKHAGASDVEVEISTVGDEIRIVVSDNGKGFPFKGIYDLAELSRLRRGPLTLKERIVSLGGKLVIESTDTGAHLDIRIPRSIPGVAGM